MVLKWIFTLTECKFQFLTIPWLRLYQAGHDVMIRSYLSCKVNWCDIVIASKLLCPQGYVYHKSPTLMFFVRGAYCMVYISAWEEGVIVPLPVGRGGVGLLCVCVCVLCCV